MGSSCNSKGCNTSHFHQHGQTQSCSSVAPSCHARSDGHDHSDGCCSGTTSDEDPESESLTGKGVHYWHISGIDCPSCVKKIEKALVRVAGVANAHVSFSTMRLQVAFSGNANLKGVYECVDSLGFQLADLDEEPAPEPSPSFLKKNFPVLLLAVLLGAGALLSSALPGASQIILIFATLWGVLPIARKALNQAQNGTPFGIETLMTVAALGALVLGEYLEAGMVLLLFMIGEQLEGLAASSARKGVESLMALSPDRAVRMTSSSDGSEIRETVLASRLVPGDIIEVMPGDRLAVDGELMTSAASFDESALTGESVPVGRQSGEKVMAGSLCSDRVARLKVISEPGNNAIDRIVKLIEEAEESKAPIERFIDRFSRWYTPSMMVISALVVVAPPLVVGADWGTWVYRGLTLLLIACPCALVISTPAAVTSGLARAARQGILIKGGAVLEQLGAVRQVALDKTGTLTEGRPEVVDIVAFHGLQNNVLSLAAAVEQGSRHPLAQAVVRKAEADNTAFVEAENITSQIGTGVSGQVGTHHVVVGSPRHLAREILKTEGADKTIAALEEQGCTVIGVVSDRHLEGVIAIRDTVREDAVEAVKNLKQLGVSSIMLTGDNPRAAAAIAGELGIDFRAGLLPEDKVTEVRTLEQQAPVAMVGDGINDAPALKSAHVGIAMGKGTDVALETADAALTHERVKDLASMIDLSRTTLQIVRQNVIFAVGIKAVFLVTSMTGLTGLMLAVLADTGATALVTMNALRLLRRKNRFQ